MVYKSIAHLCIWHMLAAALSISTFGNIKSIFYSLQAGKWYVGSDEDSPGRQLCYRMVEWVFGNGKWKVESSFCKSRKGVKKQPTLLREVVLSLRPNEAIMMIQTKKIKNLVTLKSENRLEASEHFQSILESMVNQKFALQFSYSHCEA